MDGSDTLNSWPRTSTRVPFSGIIRIRDMMYSVADPFRLDQGDVSFDAPDTVKSAMTRAIAENKSHYLQTTGVPRLRELIAAKLRDRNAHPGRRSRGRAGHQRRHSRALHHLPRAARAGRRSAGPGSGVAAGRGQHPRGERRAGRRAASMRRTAGATISTRSSRRSRRGRACSTSTRRATRPAAS